MRPFICALLLLGMVPGAQAQEPAWAGTYTADDAGAEQIIEKAIEAAVAKMNFVTRAVARGRLKKTNAAYRRVEIAQRAGTISVRFDDRKPVEMPADGSAVKWTREDGEVFDVTAQARDGRLVQTFKAEDGQRVNAFSADAAVLTLQVEITSPRLPAPLTYTLRFKRAAGQASLRKSELHSRTSGA